MTHTLAKGEQLDEQIEAVRRRWATPWMDDPGMRYVFAKGDIDTLIVGYDTLQARISELEAQAIADGWNIADTDRRYHEAMEENEHLEQQLARLATDRAMLEAELAQAQQRSAGEEAGTP